jgi:IS30 family transposase
MSSPSTGCTALVGGLYAVATAVVLIGQPVSRWVEWVHKKRARAKIGKFVADVGLREFVQAKLKRRWSPEQIAQALRWRFPGQPYRHVVHETIYQAVYRRDLGGLCRDLPRAGLRTGRLRRRPHPTFHNPNTPLPAAPLISGTVIRLLGRHGKVWWDGSRADRS